jgi:hypothetical protein
VGRDDQADRAQAVSFVPDVQRCHGHEEDHHELPGHHRGEGERHAARPQQSGEWRVLVGGVATLNPYVHVTRRREHACRGEHTGQRAHHIGTDQAVDVQAFGSVA